MLINFLRNHKTFIIYVFWGGVATLLNVFVFMFCLKMGWHYQIGNILAWFLAVLVTYLSNKFLVFKIRYQGLFQLIRELLSFLIVRLFALVLDMFIIWLGIQVMRYNSFVVKLFDNVVVGIANYLISRWYIFTDKGK